MAPSRALTRPVVHLLSFSNQSSRLYQRCFASIAPETGTGPLAGVRVLDMTRVLAGVREKLHPVLLHARAHLL